MKQERSKHSTASKARLLLIGMVLLLLTGLVACQPELTVPSTPTSTASPTTGATLTATATPTVTPTATPTPGEDFKFSGTIESMTGDTWVIGGKSFKVTSTTILDEGLAVGVMTNVEFTVTNGENVAIEIETPAQGVEAGEDFKFTGAIQSMTGDTWTIGGKSFKVTSATILDQGLAAGVVATVEFTIANGQNTTVEIETAAAGAKPDENFHFSGNIESISGNTWVIGGKTFKTDIYTVLDTGLVMGVPARVEFVLQPDGTLLATQIETP